MEHKLSVNEYIAEHLSKSLEAVLEKDRYAVWRWNCPGYTDCEFLYSNVVRANGLTTSGRHFLQNFEDLLDKKIKLTTYFDGLHSPRRLQMTKAVEEQSYQCNKRELQIKGVDYLCSYSDLDGYEVNSYDGHFVDNACHTPKNEKGKIFAAGFIYSLDMRTGLMRPLCLVTNGTDKSHEGPAFRAAIIEKAFNTVKVT